MCGLPFLKQREMHNNNEEDLATKEALSFETEKIPMIPIDDIVLEINKDIVKCNLCQEDFEQIYVNDQNLLYKTNFQAGTLKDGWYLKNAVWSGADVIHPTCSNE